MKRHIIILISILTISCSSEVDPNYYLQFLDVTVSNDYTVIKNESSAAIGDFAVEIELKLGPKDYTRVVNLIKKQPNFELLDSLDHYPFGLENNSWNEIKSFACKRNMTYYRHLYLPDTTGRGKGYETYSLYVLPDSTLTLQYIDE